MYGANGEWERVTEETGLPLFVCNRTGQDVILNFTHAQSVVAHRGRQLLSMASDTSRIFVLDWSVTEARLRSQQPIELDYPDA